MVQLSPGQLAKFEERLRSAGAPVVDQLLPGLSEDEIRSAFSGLDGVSLPQELVTWWQWHGGVDPLRASYAELGGTGNEFLSPYQSADAMLAWKREHPERVEWIGTQHPRKAIECVASSPDLGRIFATHEGEPEKLLLPSLGSLMDTWIDFLDRGVWFYTQYELVTAADYNPDLIPAGDWTARSAC